ncbi:MAG TPA: DUF4262 domain-containing protein [Candidatus Paceibacterota bacterium]|nr:DUF4262 domain-containing protein [Candidatus Paceibacterota bacterium]
MTARYIESLRNPRIKGFEWQQPEDDADRKMFRDILECGCQVIAIEAGENSPDFSYSVGLFLNFLHPEILIMGISGQSCHKVINQICQEAAEGKTIAAGDERADFPDIHKPVRFAPVDKERYFDYLGYAAWFYRSLLYQVTPVLEHKFPVLQALWPDKDLFYPDNPKCNQAVCNVQKLFPKPNAKP